MDHKLESLSGSLLLGLSAPCCHPLAGGGNAGHDVKLVLTQVVQLLISQPSPEPTQEEKKKPNYVYFFCFVFSILVNHFHCECQTRMTITII